MANPVRPALRALARPLPSSNAIRTFSSTTCLYRQTPSHLTVPKEQVPDYKYGPFYTYKTRNSGLYAGTKVQFGNVVAHKYNNKSPHKWTPNIHTKRLWSPALNAFVRTRVSIRVLRTIDKLGGIDNYLLGEKSQRIKDLGPAGWAIRWKVMQSPMIQARWAKEREALGLPPNTTGVEFPAGFAEQGVTADALSQQIDGMLERDEVFELGKDAEGEAGTKA